MQLEDWLDDLCVRFIINIPQEELIELERICFQIEEAQWFYEDFIRPLDPKLPSLGLKPFFQRIISRCPVFKDRPHEDWSSAYDRFILYKNRVPVRGAILLNDQMDQILLVKGWKKHATWSFPRGKINKDEADIDCAIREAWEETGFDIKSAGLVKDSRKIRHIEKTLRDQSVKLFVFRGVPTSYGFVPQTRKEISKCEWYKIADLPTSTKAKHANQEGTGQHLVQNANKFYMVAPFVQELKKIINQFRKGDHRQSSKLAAPPTNINSQEIEQTMEQIPKMQPNPDSDLPLAVPSTLPEVTPTSAQDRSLRLKQQLDMPQEGHLDNSNPLMSNALLNLLRGTPAAEMRNDPPTPMERPAFEVQPKSPERSANLVGATMQSPLSTFDMQHVGHSRVPPTVPTQLNQHTRSLLDALNQPKGQSPSLEARNMLPSSKQDLLAAFTSNSKPTFNAQPDMLPSSGHGKDLLQMLQRKQNTSEASTQTAAVSEAEGDVSDIARDTVLPKSSVQPQRPGPNSLLELFKSGGAATMHSAVPVAPLLEAAEAPDSQLVDSSRRTEPAELSATSDHERKEVAAESMKANILSMLGATPQKVPRALEKDKISKSSTAATLSGPILQPQYDAVKAPVSEDDMKRPTASQRKLFDPKNDEFRTTPTKLVSRSDDRNRQTKSQRSGKQQKAHTPSRPTNHREAKETPKPFQPQILKRPQITEREPISFTTSLNVNASSDGLAATMTTQSPDRTFTLPAAAGDHAPTAASTNANVTLSMPYTAPVTIPTSNLKPKAPQDPQREALLSLLRTPSQMRQQTQAQKEDPPNIDPESTPRPVVFPLASPEPQSTHIDAKPSGVSPPLPFSASQIVSPVNETDPFVSRSRVSSLASIGNAMAGGNRDGSIGATRPVIEKRQTAAGDKAFLMSYLKGFVNQGQEST